MPNGLPPYDKRTPVLNLPLPHEKNELHHDLQRITECFTIIDAEIPNSIDTTLSQVTERIKEEKLAREEADTLLDTKFTDALTRESDTRQSADDHLAQNFANQYEYLVRLVAKEVEARLYADDAHAALSLLLGAHGFPKGEIGQILAITKDGLVWIDRYELCEFYLWRHPDPKEGFYPLHGGIIENAATKFPRVWAMLQSEWGQKLCKTEAEWQAMTKAVWHTNADGSKVGWNGIGGAPFFAPNWDTGALRLPDTRGMYAEAAGFDSLGVGGTHGDGMRQLLGVVSGMRAITGTYVGVNGTLEYKNVSSSGHPLGWGTASTLGYEISLDSTRTIPTASKIQPRAYGVLTCVYLGIPR